MDFKELTQKNKEQLMELLLKQREQLRLMRFKVAQRQLKKVHEIKQVKKDIARILTVLRGKTADELKSQKSKVKISN